MSERPQVGRLLAVMYLRFTVSERDSSSHVAKGLFVAAYELVEEVERPQYAREQTRELLDWFRANLAVPRCLKQGRYPQAVCWFRPSAEGHIAKMWELAWVLRGEDLRVHLIKARNPGRVVYEDDVQVAAMGSRRCAGASTWRERVIG